MAKTSTERSRIFKIKLKKDDLKYNAFKNEDRERKRIERSEPKVESQCEIDRKKKLNRDRVRKFRALEKSKAGTKVDNQNQQVDDEVEKAYCTPQALGKAVGKVKPHLPKSPRKRKAVIKRLALCTGISLAKKKKNCVAGNKGLDSSVIQKVHAFYEMDSISRQSPGRKDFAVFWKNGEKKHLQKRHLLFYLREVHTLFLKDNPTVKIGLSKFSSLRPVNVLLSSAMPRNVCCCQYHEDIKLLCECITKQIDGFPSYSSDFVNNFVCNPDSEECMLGKCAKCCDMFRKLTKRENSDTSEDTVTWYEWERISVPSNPVKGKKKHPNKLKKMKKIGKEGTINDALASLEGKLPYFLKHVFIKRKQSTYFKETLAHLGEEECVVQVDFAENYGCAYQDEIQTAHWSQNQVTLFTVAVWTKEEEASENVCESNVIISDDKDHDKKSVAAFMWRIMNECVIQKHPNVNKVKVFSDGPSSQFKNRFIVNFLHKIMKIVHIEWNYFATSHGKGVVDGIGGTVKRLVWNAVTTRKVAAVQDALSIYKVAKSLDIAVNVLLVTSKEINDMIDSLHLQKCFSEAPPIHGIAMFHCIQPKKCGLVNCYLYSSQASMQNTIAEVFQYHSGSSESESSYSDSNSSKEDDYCFQQDNVDEKGKNRIDEEMIHDDERRDIIFEKEISTKSNDSGEKSPYCKIVQGLPDGLLSLFDKPVVAYSLPQYKSNEVQAILCGQLAFEGSHLISIDDLQCLGNNDLVESHDWWLTNFVIDEYLGLIKSACQENNVEVKTVSWEIFQTCKSCQIAQHLEKDEHSVSSCDLILIPCNQPEVEHWFLLAVFPKKKIVVILDSLTSDVVKPAVQKVLIKMERVLKELDCNLKEWTFICNSADDIPQQGNTHDCGIYTCLYARCLAERGPMVQESCFSNYDKVSCTVYTDDICMRFLRKRLQWRSTTLLIMSPTTTLVEPSASKITLSSSNSFTE